MYQITELGRGIYGGACYVVPRLFFSIYYKTGDDAFKHASDNWMKIVKTQEGFNNGDDHFYSREIYTENDFMVAWKEINDKATAGGYQVWAGHVLSHASKQTDSNDGLEFHKVGNEGTLKQDEILGLKKLAWSDSGYLILAGCNTGLAGQRGWTPAEAFSRSQGVPTIGQTGYAYFSENWCSYDEKESADRNICLWAYKRGKNDSLGGGGRMLGKVY